MLNKILPMTGVEPRTSGIESDRSTNWATTTSQKLLLIISMSGSVNKLDIILSIRPKVHVKLDCT